MAPQVEKNANNFLTNTISSKREQETAKLKQEQEDKVKSLFTKLEEQRKVYAETKQSYYSTKFQTYVLKNRTEQYQSSSYLKTRYQEKYETSEMSLKEARHNRDAELSRLESYTDAFCSANSASIFTL